MAQTTNRKHRDWKHIALCVGLFLILIYTGKPDSRDPVWISLAQAGLAVALFVCWYFPILKKMFGGHDDA
jgi:hypothetical protein